MESQHERKLSHLSLLFKVIRADNETTDQELQFMLRIANRLGLTSGDIDRVLKEEIPFNPPVQEGQRLVLFHQILILIYIDSRIDKKELQFIRQLGLRLGLNPYAVREVLERLKNNPEEGINPEIITDIFRSYNN